MKKRFFDVAIGGYYLCSMVLGALMFVIMLLLPHDLNYWSYSHNRTLDGAMTANKIAEFLPSTNLYNRLFIDGHSYTAPATAFCSIMIVIIAVAMIGGHGTSRAWRTKVLQSMGVAGFLICVDMTFQYAFANTYDWMSPLMSFIPICLMIIPLLILKKTRQPIDKTEQEITGMRGLKHKFKKGATGSAGRQE